MFSSGVTCPDKRILIDITSKHLLSGEIVPSFCFSYCVVKSLISSRGFDSLSPQHFRSGIVGEELSIKPKT
jgi:hypothetical protein